MARRPRWLTGTPLMRSWLAVPVALALLVGVGLPATLVAQPAQASTAPVLEFKRDASRAAWVHGGGGNYFGIWECPQGSLAVGVQGAEASGYVYRFGLICRYVDVSTGTWGAYAYTPTTHSGATTQLICSQGQALVRVDVWTMSTYGYPIASETEPYCQALDFGDVNASPRQVPELTGAIAPGPDRYFGTRHGSLFGRVTCGTGKFIIAIDGMRGSLLDGLGVYCGAFTSKAASISNITLSGSTQFGMPVVATPTASGGPAPTMTYQWYRCDSADATTKSTIPAPPECELITGATDSSYVPQITDYGQHLRVVATATNYFGSATMVSPTTPAPSVPVPTIDLPDSMDSGTSVTDNHTKIQQPSFTIGRLVPTALVTVTATKGADTHTCTFIAAGVPDDTTGAPASGGCIMPVNLSDGTWAVSASQTYTPKDADGNSLTPITSASASLSMVVDTTPPVIGAINLRRDGSTGAVVGDGNAIAAAASNTFWLGTPTATDAHAGTVITCSIDGGPYTVCPSSYRNLAPGSHTLTVRAIDKAGNESTKAHTWFVVTPPAVDLDPASDSGHSNTDANTNDNTPRILVSGLVVGATVTVTATRSGQTSRTCTFTATGAVNGCDAWKIAADDTTLSDGTWNYSAVQRYEPGGSGTAATSSVSNNRNVIIDTVAPSFVQWSGQAFNSAGSQTTTFADGGTVRGNLTWRWRVSPTWSDTYLWHGTCSFNGGSQVNISTTNTTQNCGDQLNVPSGTHTFVYARTDVAGNQAAPRTFRWTILNLPVLSLDPASDTGSSSSDRITSDSTPSMKVADVAPGATVTVTATRSGFPTITCTFTAPAAVAPATSSEGSCDLPQLQDATNWSVRASQSLNGATELSNTVTLNVDTTRPVPALPTIRAGTSSGTILANEGVTTETTAWISAVTTVTGETRQCRLDGTFIPCPTTNTAYPNLSAGNHTFEVVATDTAGNVGISSTTWRILGKPVVSLDAASDTGASDSDRITRDSTPQINVSNLSGGGGTVTVTATKAGSTSLTCTFVATSTSGRCDLPDAVDGTWSITAVESVRVGASTVNSATADPMAVTIDTVTPTKPTASVAVNGIAVTSGNVIQLGSGVASGALTFASGPASEAGATLLCSLNGATAVPCPAGGYPNVANGMNSLTVSAVDVAGNSSAMTIQWFQVSEIVLGLDPSSSLKTDSAGNVMSSSRTQSVSASGFVPGALVTVTATDGGATVTCAYDPGLATGCPLTFATDGVWAISASQTVVPKDADGNDLPPVTTSRSLDPLTVDTTAPDLTSSLRNAASALVAGTAGSTTEFKTSETTLALSIATTDLTATTVTCALDGGAAGPCPAHLTNLTYGVHTLVVTATDAVGNTSTDTLTWHVTAAPTVALASASDTGKSSSDGFTKDVTPTITFGNLGTDVDVVVTATKGGETVRCYLWHANEAGPAPGSASCDFGSLIDGSWTITATQTISGRPEWTSPASAPTTVVVDSAAPSTPTATFTNSITPGAVTTQTSFGFASGPTSTDVSSIDYTCVLNGGASAPCGSLTDLPAGSHRLVYTATDLAGNTSTGTLAWTIIAPPSVSLKPSSDSGASNSDGITSDSSPVIRVSDLIPGASVVVTAIRGSESVTCTLIAGPPANASDASSTGECTLSGIPSDGSWTVTAVQSLGGTSSSASAPTTVTLDTTPPAMGTPTNVVIDGVSVAVLANPDITAIAGGVAVPTGSGTQSQSITLTLPGKEVSVTRTCKLDGAVHDCSVTTLTGLATGVHTFRIIDTDAAGNETNQTYVWSVVGPPTVALVRSSDSGAADQITKIDTPEFSAGALIDGATVEITATQGALSRSCTFVAVGSVTSCPLPPLADGVWSVTARQGFGSGWSLASAAVWVTIDATAPADLAVTLTSGGTELVFADGDETGSTSASLAVGTPTSTDASAVTYTCSLNGGAAASCAALPTSLAAGKYTLTVVATDVAGNVSQMTRGWTVVAPPVIALAQVSDTGVVGDGETSETQPVFEVTNLMPAATVTVNATKANVIRSCTFVAPSAVAPGTSSVSSCQLDGPLEGTGWTVRATQTYVTATLDPSDRVTLASGDSNVISLDIVLPQPLSITVPSEVPLEEETVFVQVENVAVPTNPVDLSSLSPNVCTEDNGEVTLIGPGVCTLRGTASRWVDSSGGRVFDEGRKTVSFQVVADVEDSEPPGGDQRPVVPGDPKPEDPKPEDPKPEDPKPEDPKPEDPKPEDPVKPEKPVKPEDLRPPPPPSDLRITPGDDGGKSLVRITLPRTPADRPIEIVVIVVFDADGNIVRRISVEVPEGSRTITRRIDIPEGGTARAYTTNGAGVSNRAPVGANVIEHNSIIGKRDDGRPILYGKKIAKPVFFGPDSPELDRRARRILDDVARYVAKNGGTVYITGFIRKGPGPESFAKQLSSERAQQVAEYLSALGVDTWIRYDGAGAYREIDPQISDRRVEIRWAKSGIPGGEQRGQAP